MNKKKLTKKELEAACSDLQFFTVNAGNTKLQTTFDFKDHISALAFIARVTVHAEVNGHHPELIFTHRRVKVVLTTHDQKGLTRSDLKLAKKIEALALTQQIRG